MYMDKGEFFTIKMMDLYGQYEDTLTRIVSEREMYDTNEDPAFQPYKEILHAYDMYKKINGSDPDVSEALHATCLWYIYKNIADDNDPLSFLDEITDDKGKNKVKLNFNNLAMHLIKKYCIVSAHDCIYCYIDDKYYETQDRLSKDLVKILRDIGWSDHSKVKDIINDVIYRIKQITQKFKDFPFNKKAKFLIPVRNGVIVRRNINELLPQSPVWGFTFSLPISFNKQSDTKPIKDFIRSLVNNDEDYELLLQIPAHALLQDENYQQAYLLTGQGANGKSTYITLTTHLVGGTNITAISLQELSENRFSAAELQGKLLNMYPDLPKHSLKSTGLIKALTGGDEILVEKKYAHPFKLRNKAVFCFSANELPEVSDGTFAFWRRWAIVGFPFTFKVDPTLLSKLETPENMSGYLNLVIDKMDRIENYGLTRSSKVEDAMLMWKKRSNSAYAFVSDVLEKATVDYIRYDSLYNLYLNFCEEGDFTALGKQKLTAELEKFGGIVAYATEDQQRVKVIRGIKLKKKKIPEVQPVKEPEESELKFENK